MNRYPLWKNLLVLSIVLVGLLFALPNIFGQDPVLEVTSTKASVEINEATVAEVTSVLETANIGFKRAELDNGRVRIRFNESADQLLAKEALEVALPNDYTLALNLSTDVPPWLQTLGAEPMNLGLDLRGGIHVLIDVDMETAVSQTLDRYNDEIRALLREEKIRYVTVRTRENGIDIVLRDAESRDQAAEQIGDEFRNLDVDTREDGTEFIVRVSASANEIQSIRKFALDQNITTLRNRVNQLGVAEPLIQQQGERRIVVQLPGAQDPGRLKEILGATATLEYRLVDTEHSVQDAVDGKVPPGAKLYKDRDGQPVLLKKRVIVTGNQITDASSGIDSRSGGPAVSVSLDGQGGEAHAGRDHR